MKARNVLTSAALFMRPSIYSSAFSPTHFIGARKRSRIFLDYTAAIGSHQFVNNSLAPKRELLIQNREYSHVTMVKDSKKTKSLKLSREASSVISATSSIRMAPSATQAGPGPNRNPSNLKEYRELFEYYKVVNAPKQLLIKCQDTHKQGLLNPGILACGIKILFQMKRSDLACSLFELRNNVQWIQWLKFEATSGDIISLVKTTCRASEIVLSESIMSDAGIVLPLKGMQEDLKLEYYSRPEINEIHKIIYPSYVSMLFRTGNRTRALEILDDMAREHVFFETDVANRLIRFAQQRKDLRAVFSILDVMSSAKVPVNDYTYEVVANAAVRNVEFVTGAVSMETLPVKHLPEAAFIGRSNVGKSSLINMVCNRKALAYTSKRPGKTQQFNYFEVNGGTSGNGIDQENYSFYLVDMPGHGYAKVPGELKASWQKLLGRYVLERQSLRVIFHLVDGRHGPLAQDLAIMEEMKYVPSYARYVLVLTKADKQDNTVSASVMAKTVMALRESGVENVPIVITSSETKLGRIDMWRYLRLAALDNIPVLNTRK